MKGLASKLALCFCLVFGVAGCAFERPMAGPGQVTPFGELPCFSVGDNAVTRQYPPEVGALNVYERLDSGATQSLWELSFESSLFLLKPSQCILYGTTPATSKTTIKAAPLVPGKRYELDLWAYLTPSPTEETRGLIYYARFCLTHEGEKTVVHPVRWDKALDKWRWDVCGLQNE